MKRNRGGEVGRIRDMWLRGESPEEEQVLGLLSMPGPTMIGLKCFVLDRREYGGLKGGTQENSRSGER
jgi:hypothetical protein